MRQESIAATLAITSNVRGAQVLLNGELVGTTPLERAGIDPGFYRVEVRKQGFSSWSAEMELTRGAVMRLRAPLDRQIDATTAPADAADAPSLDPANTGAPLRAERDADPSGSVNWGAWSVITVGSVALAGSATMALLLKMEQWDLEDRVEDGSITQEDYNRSVSRGNRYELTHYVLLGVGVVGVGTGLVWLLVEDDGRSLSAPPRSEPVPARRRRHAAMVTHQPEPLPHAS